MKGEMTICFTVEVKVSVEINLQEHEKVRAPVEEKMIG
jgi:hypothetical protein